LDAKRRIMVVDDDPGIGEAMADVLSDEGYAVQLARNGVEALRQLRDGERPAMILLDLMMPVMDGFGFRVEQSSDPVLKDIPVVVVTAGTLDDRVSSMSCADVLTKPIAIERLLETIERLAR
jgi:CheY-like chemotaxis protein